MRKLVVNKIEVITSVTGNCPYCEEEITREISCMDDVEEFECYYCLKPIKIDLIDVNND